MAERFTPEVSQALTEGGWTPDDLDQDLLDRTLEYVELQMGRDGASIESFPAAVTAIKEFGGVCVIQDGPGADFRLRPFMIDPSRVAASTESLSNFGGVIGSKLFPLGMEGDHESIIAIAETGHVFALDHTGEWHLGDSMDAALERLVTGSAPERVASNGSW